MTFPSSCRQRLTSNASKANKEILTAHLKNCIRNADTDEEREEKVDELVAMLGKIL